MKRIWTLALVSLVLLGGCQMPLSPPPLPTVGPVHERSGKPGIIDTELTTSTNCAEVGETLVIRGIVKNEASYPLRFVGTLAFDFIIRPWNWDPTAGPEPVRRWSRLPTILQSTRCWRLAKRVPMSGAGQSKRCMPGQDAQA